MAGVHIVDRSLKSGAQRFHLRLSASRYEPITHLGSFATREEAEVARSRAKLMLSEGEVPTRETLATHRVTIRRVTVRDAADAMFATRVDLNPSTLQTYRAIAQHAISAFGSRDVRSLTVDDVQAWIVALRVEPRVAPKYLRLLRMILAFAGVDPNPARTARNGEHGVRTPYAETRDFRLPRRVELAALYPRMAKQHALSVLLLEHTGMRASEAAGLKWTDRDAKKQTLHIRNAKTKAGWRFIDDLDTYPDDLVGLLDHPTKSSSLILGGLTAGAIASALRGGCKRAEIPHYSPHDLRHLHASRLLAEGWTPADVQHRLGHANAAITLGIYTHVIPPD